MKRRATIVLALLLSTWLGPWARADEAGDVQARLRSDLKFLAGDDCEGRGISTKGINLAADYIAREFEKAGLKPGGTAGFFQPFALATGVKTGPNNRLVLHGQLGQQITLEPGRHFHSAGMSANAKAEAPMVFAGYGIVSDDPKYDDYAGLDVTGKVVILLSTTPRFVHREANVFRGDGRSSPQASLATKIQNAARRKAAAVLVVNRRMGSSRFSEALPRTTASPRDGDAYELPVAHLRREQLSTMLLSATGLDLAQTEQQIDADLKPRSTPLWGWTCVLQTDVARTQITVKNVIGVLEGNGPLAQETVVVGAHYDHVGFGQRGSFGGFGAGTSGPGEPGGVGLPRSEMSGNVIHRGADDNASGTVTLLELARRFATPHPTLSPSGGEGKVRAGRRLVFIAFTAEENGLLGSAYYCRNPVFPLADTVAMVNMDMVGRLQDNKLMVGGLGSAPHFRSLIEKLNETHGFDLWKEPSGQGPSDHASFYAQKIPVFKFFTGFHEQYHRPTDRVETLNVPGIRRIGALVGDVTAELKTSPTRPAYAKTPGFDRTTTLWAGVPATGILPDYADAKVGVLLEGAVNNTPAARAGLKKGDRLLALAGQPVQNAEAFLLQARALKPGSKVEATIERDGKQQKVELQLASPRTGGFSDPRFGFLANMTDMRDGILLTEVPENTTAAKAGLKTGDRILSINGEELTDAREYLSLLRALETGEVVTLTVARDKQQLQVPVEVAASTQPGFNRFGAVADPRDSEEGALLARVIEDSPAAALGLRAGDWVKSINGQAVKDADGFNGLVRGVRPGDKIELEIVREGKTIKQQGIVK